MDLKTRLEVLPCGKCEDMINSCDNCIFVKEAKELYQQIRADAIEEFKNNLLDGELYRCTDGNEYIDVADIEYVAEQLKEQRNEI